MPAKDRQHDIVVRALIKDDCKIISEQMPLVIAGRHLWIDIEAAKHNESAILIEVKGFEHMPSPIDYLASAVGKYVLYKFTLEYLEIPSLLYMAVPLAAYHGILSEEIGRQVIQKVPIKLVLFDPAQEEIVQWIG